MGKERNRHRITSRVDSLPAEGKELLNTLLLDTRNTYAEIAEKLTERGWPISKSSIGRYALRSNKAAQRIREASEQTSMLIAAVRDNHDIDATEVATAILTNGLTQRLAAAEEEFDDMTLEDAGRLLVQIQRSAVYKRRYIKGRKDACAAIERTIQQRLREEIHSDPELLARLEAIVSTVSREEAAKDE